MHQESYQYQCQITGKVKAYKKMSGQVARALNWTLAERGCYGRWVAQTASGEAGHAAEPEQQGPNSELLRPDGPALIPLLGTRQRTAQYGARYLKKSGLGRPSH